MRTNDALVDAQIERFWKLQQCHLKPIHLKEEVECEKHFFKCVHIESISWSLFGKMALKRFHYLGNKL